MAVAPVAVDVMANKERIIGLIKCGEYDIYKVSKRWLSKRVDWGV